MDRAVAQPASARERLSAVVERANKGQAAAIAEAREILGAEPELWEGLGQLAALAMGAWVRAVVGTSPLAQEGVRRHLAKLRDELVGESASPLERLLIQRVQITWLQVWSAEIMYAEGQASGMSVATHDFHQRRITQSQKRYLAAIRALATVRRLLAPAGPNLRIARVDQVNVATDGGQQVNATVSSRVRSDALAPPC